MPINNGVFFRSIIPSPDEHIKELRKDFQNTYRSNNGLTVQEIMVLYYARRFCTDSTEFSSFWLHKYCVDDVRAIINKLLCKGFIYVDDAIKGLAKYRQADLKSLCEQYGLKKSGKNIDLVQRILESVPQEEIERIVVSRPYNYTALGLEEIDDNDYVPYFHITRCNFSTSINVRWMNRELHKHPEFKSHWRDRIWGELNKETQDAMLENQKGNYSFYISNRETMAQFLMEEEKYEESLRLITEATYWQVNKRSPTDYTRSIKYGIPFDEEHPTFLFANDYSALQKEMGLTCEEMAFKIREFAPAQRFHNEVFTIGLISAWIIAQITHNNEQDAFLKSKYLDALKSYG